MKEILTVNNDTQTVSARELHERLNIGTHIINGFQECVNMGLKKIRITQ